MHIYHKYFLLASLLPLAGGLSASDFTVFPPTTLTIDRTLPTWTTQHSVSLGQPHTYTGVRLLYPEYAPLTTAEIAQIKRYNITVPDTITTHIQVGIARKVPQIELRVVPFVRRGGKYLRLMSAKIALLPTQHTTTSNPKALAMRPKVDVLPVTTLQERYAKHSVLATGRWYKISVPHTGIYQLTAQQLQRMGFADISRIKIYGYGGAKQAEVINYEPGSTDRDDLQQIPLYRRTDAVLFFAQGTISWSPWTYNTYYSTYQSTQTQNPYASQGYYLITEGDNPASLQQLPAVTRPVRYHANSFPERALHEEEAFGWLSSGRHLYEAYDYAQGNTRTYTLETPDAVPGTKGIASVAMTAASTAATQTTVAVDNNSLGTFRINAKAGYYTAQAGLGIYSIQLPLAATTQVKVTTTAGHSAHLDYIRLNYIRALRFRGGALPFTHAYNDVTEFALAHPTPQTQVWRIGTAAEPTVALTSTRTKDTLRTIVADPTRQYVAVDVSATFPTPTLVGAVPNQDLHGQGPTDMVIILPQSAKLRAQAERLANLHRTKDGLRVHLVRADEIYNEFSSGTPDAMAYRRYLKMLYDRATKPTDIPRYLLLFGPSAWDNRMLTPAWAGYNPADYLLAYESDNSLNYVNSYVTDDFFGFLDDNEQHITRDKIDIGIGRINPVSVQEATTIVDKIEAYMDNKQVGAWKNMICMMADDGNYNRHMEDADSVARQITNSDPRFQIQKIYWDAYRIQSSPTGMRYPEATTLIKNTMNQGALIMNYTGHGSPTLVSHEQVLRLADFANLPQARSPFWSFAACEVTPFDGQTEYISKTALFNTHGSAIAVYGASRDVYAAQNFLLNKQIMKYLLDKDADGNCMAIGDAIRLAKVGILSGFQTDESENKLKYILLGDPALRLTLPTLNIVIDSVNGKAAPTQPIPLQAGSILHLKGRILHETGASVPQFRGIVTASLFDRMETIQGRENNPETNRPFVFQTRTKALFEGNDSVTDGGFSISIPVPMDISYTTDTGKLFLYAASNDHKLEAHGTWDKYYLNGTASATGTDTIPPKVFAYLNAPDLPSNTLMGTSPLFVAQISDSSGINTTGMGIGHDLELIIDNNPVTTYVLNDYFKYEFGSFQRGTVSFRIPTLTAGKHQLKFRSWDLHNNASTSILDFVVSASAEPQLLRLGITANPASHSTRFLIDHDQTDDGTIVQLTIYDLSGRPVMDRTLTDISTDGHLSYEWGLDNNAGARLPGGIYLCKVTLTTSEGKQSTQTQKIVLLGDGQ